MSAAQTPRFTPAEYLELERAALDVRSEYFDGRMFAMSGASYRHGLISTRTLSALCQAVTLPCQPIGPDLRVGVTATGPYLYPDVSVHCGAPELMDGQKDTLLNPILIVEVLSPSTESFDRGKKFAAYRRIPSLQQYLLISQDEPMVESYQKGDPWTFSFHSGLDAIYHLPGIGCQLRLAEIYRDIVFEPAQ